MKTVCVVVVSLPFSKTSKKQRRKAAFVERSSRFEQKTQRKTSFSSLELISF